MTNCLEELFNFSKETCLKVNMVAQGGLIRCTIMVDRYGQLNGSKMTRTFSHVFLASGTFEVAIDRTQMRVVETFLSRSKTRFILQVYDVRNVLHVMAICRVQRVDTDHSLRIFDRYYSHSINLLFREETKLDLFDGAQFRARMREVEIRHD